MSFEIFSMAFVAAAPQEIVSPILSPEIQLIQSKGLVTPEGRESFLQNELTPFILYVDALNCEIQKLGREMSSLKAETTEEREEMLDATNVILAKMDEMKTLLPILENTLLLEEDFASLDAILAKTAPLEASEEAVLKRVADLCAALDSWSH